LLIKSVKEYIDGLALDLYIISYLSLNEAFHFSYFVIFEHHHHYSALAIDTNNISLMNTSTKITFNGMPHMNSFDIISFSLFSSIILCLYVIFHNQQLIPMMKEKINTKSFHNNIEQDLLTINVSSLSMPSVSIQQTSPVSSKTISSNKSNRSF